MSDYPRAEFFALRPVGGISLAMVGLGAAGIVVSSAVVLFNLVTEGHSVFGTSNDIPWGLPIATYVFFVLTSTGLTFVASLAMVFGFKPFYPITKRCIWLAVVTLIAGFSVLAFEIGHPFRMIWAFPTGLQARSPMFWMGLFYSLYLVLLLLKFLTVHLGDWDSPVSRGLGVASFVTVVLAHGNLGALFGMMAMRPFWYDGLTAVYFLVTAALSGVAFAVLFTYLSNGVSRQQMPENLRSLMTNIMPGLFAAVLGVTIVFMGARIMNGLWSNLEGLETFYLLLSSPWFHLEIWVGLVLPFFILLSPKLRGRRGMLLLPAALVILALFIGRYEYVIGGQLVPLFRGIAQSGFAQYTPSFTEWMLVVLGVAITSFLYGAGEWLLRLADTPAKGHGALQAAE
ncbi:MAG: NrfD/PsrC family molybdoenzyme membrane anchor subunit [Dongiaceae bacterium]